MSFVGVFPEATVSQSFCLKEFKSGAARMAMESDTPRHPADHLGQPTDLDQGPQATDDQRRSPHTPVTISMGAPIRPLPGETAEALSTTRVRDVMQEMLTAVQKSYAPQPAGPDDRWWLPDQHGRHRAHARGGVEGRQPPRPRPRR